MQKRNKLSNNFIKNLAKLVGGTLTAEKFDNLIKMLENEIKLHCFTPSSESNLIRILENQFDKIFFLKECLQYPHHAELLISVCSNSNYLSDILVRNPGYFYSITNPDKIKLKLSDSYYKESINNLLVNYRSFESRVNALRNFRRKEILRIGIADIFLKARFKLITDNLSELAKALSSALFHLCYKQILEKHNIEKTTNSYCVISLGKLGGNELNYSSDIDLIVLINKNALLKKRIYYSQILTETIQLFIEQSALLSPNGFLYRVDFRLRPYGKNASLCGSLGEYLQYYELRAEEWEKQMLIKTGFVCGSKSLYNKFVDFTQQIIYPKSFSVSPLVYIKKMKSNIEKLKPDNDNIKIIPGGLRDIEFSIQALQLIHGGRIETLRTGNTLKALDILSTNQLLTTEEFKIYKNAYLFYRKIEHYLQLMNNTQTHTIPDSGEVPDKLAYYLGFRSAGDFREKLNELRNEVLQIYNSITGVTVEKNKVGIDEINFSDRNRALSNHIFLRNGKGVLGTKKFDNSATALFDSLQPELFNYLQHSVDPDKVLENFARFIRSSNLPNIWYREFADNKFFMLFLKICEFSQYAIDLSAENKLLRDYMLSRKCFLPINISQLIHLNTGFILLTLSVQYCAGLMKASEVSYVLSDYVDNVIKKLCDEFSNETGLNNFSVIAMGSLGSRELTFFSDVDLIFVSGDRYSSVNSSNQFLRLLSTIKNKLSPFDVDCRLRPEGKSSQILWNVDSYSQYIQNRARAWEVQAFLKARLVFGNEKIFNRLIEDYFSVTKNIQEEQIKTDMLAMRSKLVSDKTISSSINLKKSPGSLTDIEFITSYHLLRKEKSYKKFIGKGMVFVLKNISLPNRYKISVEDYYFLKELDLAIQGVFDTGNHRIPDDINKQKLISVIIGFKGSLSYIYKLRETLANNIKVFNNLFLNK